MKEMEILLPVNTQNAVRAMLRRKVRRLSKTLLSPECHQNLHTMIEQQTCMLRLLQWEARRKKRTKSYEQLCQSLLLAIAESEVGPLAQLPPEQVEVLERFLDAFDDGLRGKAPIHALDGGAFIALQKKIFVPPQKRGPKPSVDYDHAYLRNMHGEMLSVIAREMDPYGFQRNPDASMQKFHKAFRRRRADRRLHSKIERT